MGQMGSQLHSSQTGRARSQRQVLATMRQRSPEDEASVRVAGRSPVERTPGLTRTLFLSQDLRLTVYTRIR